MELEGEEGGDESRTGPWTKLVPVVEEGRSVS